MPANSSRVWTREEAFTLIDELSRRLAPDYYLGLAGSLLLKESSTNDLDLIIYPACSLRQNYERVSRALIKAGLRKMHSRDVVHAQWRKLGSEDTKHVEVWSYNGRKVDIFWLS